MPISEWSANYWAVIVFEIDSSAKTLTILFNLRGIFVADYSSLRLYLELLFHSYILYHARYFSIYLHKAR